MEELIPEATFEEGSTAPLFASFFEGAEFFDTPQEAGGIYALGKEDQTNIILFGEAGGGNDVYAGGDEVDVVMGASGGDNIIGAEGTDFLFGGMGDDIVRGGAGDDVVVGNEGSDLAISGEGADVYEFFADQFVEGERDILLDFEDGMDSVVIVGSTDVSYDQSSGLISVDGSDFILANGAPDLSVITRADSSVLV